MSGNNSVNDFDNNDDDNDDEDDDEESFKYGGNSPEKFIKLNEEGASIPALKANISKLSNDFTIR
jgi:hypothetical protein